MLYSMTSILQIYQNTIQQKSTMDINMYMIQVRIQMIRLHLNAKNVVLQRQRKMTITQMYWRNSEDTDSRY